MGVLVGAVKRSSSHTSAPDGGVQWGAGPSSDTRVAHFHAVTFRAGPRIGTPYCVSVVNSTGAGSSISASGSPSITANDLVLAASDLPGGQAGMFLAGPTPTQVPFSNGFLCIAPSGLQRFSVASAPSGGTIIEAVDLAASAPGGLDAVAGQSDFYQRWYRDPAAGGGLTSFSNGLEVTYLP